MVCNGVMTAKTLERPVTNEPQLTAADRCDRCSARARVRITLHSGGQLFFCAHHAAQHLTAIYSKASEILDERHFILED